MFTDEERNKLLEDSRSSLMAQGIPDVPGPLWRAFVERVRAKLHVVLCMSPVGETFRLRCRQLPSLVNCCTINWFSDWPPEALTYACTPLHSRHLPCTLWHVQLCAILVSCCALLAMTHFTQASFASSSQPDPFCCNWLPF